MLQVTPYTTTSSIRAVFGVSSDEIPDDVLMELPTEDAILEALLKVDPDYEDKFNEGVTEGSTFDQKRVSALIRAFAAYVAAETVILEFSAPERYTDGKTGFIRSMLRDRYDTLYKRIRRSRSFWERKLREALGQQLPEIPTLSRSAIPSFDPVVDNPT